MPINWRMQSILFACINGIVMVENLTHWYYEMRFFKPKPNERQTTSVVEIVDRKNKLDQARVDEKASGQHKHYFSKREVATPEIDPCCKVCGKLLSELLLERKMKTASERFKNASNRLKSKTEES